MSKLDKIKKGDNLLCLFDFKDQFTKGKIYKAIKYTENEYVTLIDDLGMVNGWHKDYFQNLRNNSKVAKVLYKG